MEAAAPPKSRMSANARRMVLLREGARLFGRNGYAATRLDDVAAAAGVTKPIIYRHFTSKKDLYFAILERHEADLPTFMDPWPDHQSSAELMEILLDRWLDYVTENSNSWLVLFRDRTGDPEIERARRGVSTRATEVIAAFLRESAPAIPPEEIEPTADLLRSGLAGLVLWWIDHPKVPRRIIQSTATRAGTAVFG